MKDYSKNHWSCQKIVGRIVLVRTISVRWWKQEFNNKKPHNMKEWIMATKFRRGWINSNRKLKNNLNLKYQMGANLFLQNTSSLQKVYPT